MILIGEAIQRIQSVYSKGVQSKDSRLTDRHIYSAMITARGTLIKQQSNKRQNINDWIYQIIPCVELIDAPLHECINAPNNGTYILRSKDKLPKMISDIDETLAKSITTLDGSQRFDLVEFENTKYIKGNKFTGKKTRAYIRNSYLYITTLTKTKGVTIEGLFEDPIEVFNFPTTICGDCPDCKCKSYLDLEFPIDRDLLKTMIDMSAQELVGIFTQMSEDKNTNASDDNFVRDTFYKTNNNPSNYNG